MRKRRWIVVPLALLLGVVLAAPSSPSAAGPGDQLTPVLASVVVAPIPVPQSDGQWKLVYELEVANATDQPMTIESLEVREPEPHEATVKTLSTKEIENNLVVPGNVKSPTLGPGQAGILFVNLSFARREQVPARLVHRITATTDQARGSLPAKSVENAVARLQVDPAVPISIGPPLRGDRWVAVASCCDSYHRRAALPVNGRRTLAQRFAIDWIQLDAQNRMASGDPSRNESFPQFGADAIAVADATVVHVTDGLPNHTPGALPGDTTLANADGNSVVLDLGGSRFALYAHLQPASIQVHEGERVRRGQLLGRVGNSGNTDAPHLHFHVMDGPSPLASNGLPYVIDGFELIGRAVSSDDLEAAFKAPDKPVDVSMQAPSRHTKELPADLAMVRFPG
ncbi:MAG TPA: M23 family metallopeptidase [Candidatus Bathyarchaeia archaeon]|nr:M23 family metallopeptidase [Candidatus Bathyarchaeia archaeon]